MEAIYEQLGEPGITALVAAFYRRIRNDDLLAPMYPKDNWEGSEKRLRDFLIYRLGGPDTYIQERGHPRLRMRHAPFAIGTAERDRWLLLMSEAMDETEVPPPSRESLSGFFAQVADSMRNTPG
jgi:hemoglobin